MTLLLATMLMVTAPQVAGETAPCASIDTGLPTAMQGWSTTGTGVALGSSFSVPAANGAASTLVPIARAGRYRLAIDQPASVAVVREDVEVARVADSPGPRCSSIASVMTFDLEPGLHRFSFAGLDRSRVRIMIFGDAIAD